MTTRRMFVRVIPDRLGLGLNAQDGTYEVDVPDELISEYNEVLPRYMELMQRLWDLHEQGRQERNLRLVGPVAPKDFPCTT